jgi:hypothetical protein
MYVYSVLQNLQRDHLLVQDRPGDNTHMQTPCWGVFGLKFLDAESDFGKQQDQPQFRQQPQLNPGYKTSNDSSVYWENWALHL